VTGITLAVAFLAGVLLHDSGAGLVLGLPLAGGCVVAAVLARRLADRAIVMLALVVLAFGAWRATTSVDQARSIVVRVDSDRAIDALVVGMPRGDTTRVSAQLRPRTANGRTIAASLPLIPIVRSGDVIRFWAPAAWDGRDAGTVLIPESSAGHALFIPAFEIERSSTSPLTRLRIWTNDLLTSAIERSVPEPAGALTLGVMNGDDSGMTEATRQRFRLSGMSHITAVSGWNVALVAGFLSLFTRRMAPTSAVTLLAGVGAVWTYAFIVGMGPSVIRAAGMATVFLAARWRGRQGDLVTSMLLTVAFIVGVTPSIRFDIGFQLSIAATLGIVLFVEQFPDLPARQSALALPFVAQVAVAPLQLHQFGSYSLLAPLANLLSAPLVGLVMSGGLLTVVASLVHPLAAEIAGAITWIPARLIIAIAEREAGIGGSSGTMFELGWSATFMIYVLLVLAYCGWSMRRKLIRLRQRTLQAGGSI
jgi:competence protein ComEC